MKFKKPNFDFEWDEAQRYPEFEKMGKDGWIQMAQNGSIMTYSQIKDVLGNVDLDFNTLDIDKKIRFKKAMRIGMMELPIAVKFSEESYDLIGGNTRLSGLVSMAIDSPLWIVDLSKKEKEMEIEEDCWKGYKQIGSKIKNGKNVPNCVPVKRETKESMGADSAGSFEAAFNNSPIKKQGQTEGLLDTSWENDGGDKVTLMDLLNATEDIPVSKVDLEVLKPHLLTWDGDEEEKGKIDKADLQYPILIFVEDDGSFISIIDGHHRAQKAVKNELGSIKAKVIPINSLPKNIRKVFSHMGKQDTAETTTASSAGSFEAAFNNSPIKKPITKIHNMTEESELDEAMTADSSGPYDAPFGDGGKNPLKIGGEKSIKKSRAVVDKKFPKWGGPKGVYVRVKDKCKKFPYCNQGNTGALEFYEVDGLVEAVKNVSKKHGIPYSEMEKVVINEIKKIFIR